MEFHNNQTKSEVEDPQARDEEQKVNKSLQAYKDTMTLIKLKMTKTDALIRKYNDKMKECQLLSEDLNVVKSEKQDILSKYNLTLEKNTRLELANGEFKKTIEKNEKLLETQCLKLEENEKHINQLIFKIKALEEETINLQNETKSLKTVKMVEKKVKTKHQACQTLTVEKRDISINTISKNELKKPLMVDKSFITEECKSMKNDPFPIYCAKCEVHIKPAPVEQVLRIMTMHPPLLPECVSPPTSPILIKRNTDFCDPIETEMPIGRQKYEEAEDLPLFNEGESKSSISKNHSSFLEIDKLARKVEKLENLMKKMKKNNTKQTNCQTDFSPKNIKFVVQMPSSEKLIKSYRQQKCKKNKLKRLNRKPVGYKKKEKLEENKWKIESFTEPQLRNLDSKKIKLKKQNLFNQKLEKELFEFPEEISSQERLIIRNTAVSNRSSLSPCTSEESLADFISTTRSSTITPVKNANVDRSQKSVVQNINMDKSTVPPDLLVSNPTTSQMLECKSICHNLVKDKVQENNSVNHIMYEENILNNNNSNNLSENLINNIGKELQTISGSNENENDSEIKIINEINTEKVLPNLEDNDIDSRNYSTMNKPFYANVSENSSESSNSNIHKNILEKENQKETNVENYHPFEKNNSINQLPLSVNLEEKEEIQIKNDINKLSKTAFNLISEVESSSLDNIISEEITEQISVQETRFEPKEIKKNTDDEKILPLVAESTANDKIIQNDKENNVSSLTLKDIDSRKKENTSVNREFDKPEEILVPSDESSDSQFFTSSDIKQSKLNSSVTTLLLDESSEEKNIKIKNDLSESSKTAFNLISEVESSSLDNLISKEIAGQISVQEARFELDKAENSDNEKIFPLITESNDYDKIMQKDSSDESSEAQFFSSSGLKRSKLTPSATLFLSDDSSEEKSTKIKNDISDSSKTVFNLISEVQSSSLNNIISKEIVEQMSVQEARFEPDETEKNKDNEKILPLITESTDCDKIIQKDKDTLLSSLTLKDNNSRVEENTPINRQFDKLNVPLVSSDESSESKFFSSSGLKRSKLNSFTTLMLSDDSSEEKSIETLKCKYKKLNENSKKRQKTSANRKKLSSKIRNIKRISNKPIIYAQSEPKVSQTRDESITDLPLIHSTNESSSLNKSFINLDLPIEESPPVSIPVKKHRIAHTPKSISMIKDVELVDQAAKKIKLIPQRVQATDPVSPVMKEMEMQCKQKKEISHTLEGLPEVSQTRDESITDLPLVHSTNESSSLNESFINLGLPIEESPPVTIPIKKHRIAHTPKSISMIKNVELLDQAAKKIKLIPQRVQTTDPVSSTTKQMEMQCKQKKEISHTLEELKPTLKELTKAINNENTIASNLKLENTIQDENFFKGFREEIRSEESEKCSTNILLPEISISTNHKENNIPSSSESNTTNLIQQTSETVSQTNEVQRGRKRKINVKINENLEKNPFRELRSRQVIITETPQEKKLKAKTFSIVIDETNSCLSKSIVVSHLNQYIANLSVVSCSSKAKKNRMIKVANKNKEAIEAKLNTLIEAQWTNESHTQTLNSLLDFHDLRTIAAFIIGFASEKLSGTETFDRSHTPPAPIMTETEQKLVTLIVGIEQLNPGFSGLVMDGIQYKLFKLGNPQEVQIVERLFRILVVLSKIKKDRAKVRIFCCDALYCLNIRAINIIYVALTCWPEVLPKHDSNNDIIVKTIVHIIMTLEVSRPYPKLNSLRKLLSTYYEYPNSGYMTNVFKVELLKNLQENVPGINTAVLLLCKKLGPEWSLPNIILNLKQMIVNQLHPSLYEALNLLGNILRSYPVSDPNNSVVEIIDQLCDVLARNEGADDLQEGVVSCLLSISKFKYKQIALSVIKWQFNKNLRPVTKHKLMSFFKQHDAEWWWKFVNTHFPLPK